MEDNEIQEKINYEIKMREGTVKLLEACHEQSQALEGAKNLLTINARILALMSLLQRNRKKTMSSKTKPDFSKGRSREKLPSPCKSKISVSDIRVPLMWNEEEHFRAKEGASEIHTTYHVFCILKLGGQAQETGLVEVDQSVTDVTIEDVIVFENVDADFKLNIEIYYTTTSTNNHDIYSASHKKHLMRANSDGSYGPKYVLAGHASLTVDDVDDGIKIHDVKKGVVGSSPSASAVTADAFHTANLPLWSQFCCRLAACPHSVELAGVKGILLLQGMLNRKPTWDKYWCQLKKSKVECWDDEEHSKDSTNKPTVVINLKETMKVDEHLQGNCEYKHILFLTCPDNEKEPVFACESEEEFAKWKEALQQALVDLRAWKVACKWDITLADCSPKKLPAYTRLSLYDQINVDITVEEEDEEDDSVWCGNGKKHGGSVSSNSSRSRTSSEHLSDVEKQLRSGSTSSRDMILQLSPKTLEDVHYVSTI